MIIVKAGCKKNKRLRVKYGVDQSGYCYVDKNGRVGKVWWDKESGETTQIFCNKAKEE